MSSAQKGTISVCFVNEALAGTGLDNAEKRLLLIRAGISQDILSDPAARVSAQQYGALWHAIADKLDDEFFGMGRRPMKRGSFTLLCHAVINSENLEKALNRALRFKRLVIDDVEGRLQREGGQAHIVLVDQHVARSGPPPPAARVFLYSTFLVMLHGLACWLIGQRIPLLEVRFRSKAPYFGTELKNLFSDNIRFECEHSGFSFDSKYLEMRNIRDEAAMKRFLRNAPANYLVKYKDLNSLSARVRRSLRETEPVNWPSFPQLAQDLGLSQATLRRRLESEGHSYRALVDEMRKELALALLKQPALSITDIAEKLGFTEYSSFYRAFRQWTGHSPRAFRQAMEASIAEQKAPG